MERILSVDVWQGHIDWQSVHGQVSGAYIKAGGGDAGYCYADPNVITNGRSARRAGLPFGLSWVWSPDAEQAIQVMRFSQINRKLAAAFKPVVTVEFPVNPDKKTHISKLRTFLDVLEHTMVKRVMIQTPAWYWDNLWDGTSWAADYDLWTSSCTARPVVPKGWEHQILWQNIQDGSVCGIEGRVSTSICKSISVLRC